MNFKQYFTEALRLSTARKYVKGAKGKYKTYLDHIFQGQCRIEIPIKMPKMSKEEMNNSVSGKQVLHALKFMNRLDEVILLSMKDPDFLINASETDYKEIQHLITILDKSKELKIIPSSKSEIKRFGNTMVYKSQILPEYLLILFSTDSKAILETRTLGEIEETIRLLSSQLETMLKITHE